MADFHILNSNEKGDILNIIYHLNVPATINSASVTYASVVSFYLNSETVWDFGNSTERSFIFSGSIFEKQKSVELNANLTNAQKLTIIRNDYLSDQTSFTIKCLTQYKFWGYEGDA